MPPDRVHQNALASLCSRVDKVKDLVGDLVLRVEKDLILLVNPVEGQIGDANALPHVANRVARAVHNVCHFVCYDEFQVLNTKAHQ